MICIVCVCVWCGKGGGQKKVLAGHFVTNSYSLKTDSLCKLKETRGRGGMGPPELPCSSANDTDHLSKASGKCLDLDISFYGRPCMSPNEHTRKHISEMNLLGTAPSKTKG